MIFCVIISNIVLLSLLSARTTRGFCVRCTQVAQTIKMTLKRCLHRVLPDIADSSEKLVRLLKLEHFSLLILGFRDHLAFMETRARAGEEVAAKAGQVSS